MANIIIINNQILKQSERPLVFYIFCGEQVVFLFGVNCQLSCDTSEKEQIEDGIEKTRPELYSAFGCNRDNFANSLIMTRKMHQKKYSRYKPKEILAQKISISFHPDEKLSYEEAYKMAEQFAQEFFWSKGYEVLFAVHTDIDHIHAHFLVSNCNQKDGKSFRRGPKELVEMSKYFGEQCREKGLTKSVLDSFYSQDKDREETTGVPENRK